MRVSTVFDAAKGARMTAVLGVLCALPLAAGAYQEREAGWVPQTPSVVIPLPIVERAAPPNSVFDKASLILLVRVRELREVEEVDTDGGSLPVPRSWAAARAVPIGVVKVNERRKGDPDLSRFELLVEQKDRGQQPIRFEFGRLYLLLLNPSPLLQGRPASAVEVDPYSLAIPDGGFEIVNRRVVPLSRGGELESYRGRLADDVLAEIRAGTR